MAFVEVAGGVDAAGFGVGSVVAVPSLAGGFANAVLATFAAYASASAYVRTLDAARDAYGTPRSREERAARASAAVDRIAGKLDAWRDAYHRWERRSSSLPGRAVSPVTADLGPAAVTP